MENLFPSNYSPEMPPLTMAEAKKLAQAVQKEYPEWEARAYLCATHTDVRDKETQPHIVEVQARVRTGQADQIKRGIGEIIKTLAASPEVLGRAIADASLTIRVHKLNVAPPGKGNSR